MTFRWPPDYTQVFYQRQQRLQLLKDPEKIAQAKLYYKDRPIEFINHWVETYDPRNAGSGKLTALPFILFPKQEELVDFVYECLEGEASGLVEKCREIGVTWICCSISVHLWLFWEGVSIGWGSRKEQLVHRIGDLDSIFEKIYMIIRRLPPFFLPRGFDEREHLTFMRAVNPQNGASITGEAGDNIGRGGRKRIYFKDESAHYEHPELIEAALSENTRCQIDVSSVHGLGNVFHRKREAGLDWSPGQEIDPTRTNVFVMDWSDHPEKTKEWYKTRRKKFEDEGLLHVFAQEVERNYSSSVQGIIIPNEWFKSSIDAHLKLKIPVTGLHCAGLDVADGGGDKNAFCLRQGILVKHIEQWGDRDTGYTTRHAIEMCKDLTSVDVQYDAVSVGAGVKAEANRLEETKQMPKGVSFVPWFAGGRVLNPDSHIIEDDRDSPLNKDFYMNLKAQAWWELRKRFENTHRAISDPSFTYDADYLISIPSTLPLLRSLEKEVSQPTSKLSATMKVMIEKAPEGTRSPNLADALVMCYWPADGGYDISLRWVQ